MYNSLSRQGCGYELILANYFSELEHSSEFCKISRSSFSEARDKLSWEAFAFLLEQTKLDLCLKPQTWKGHRVRAVDSSNVQIPRSPEILKHFPVQDNAHGEVHYPNLRLFVAADIFTTQPTHTYVSNKHISERETLKNITSQFQDGDISILDRGFEGKKVWEHFEKVRQFFIGRIRSESFAKLRGKDTIVEYSSKLTGQIYKIRVLLGRKLSNGSYVVVATNFLNPKHYSRKEILDLYQKRQAVEEVFLHLKNTLNIKNIRSRKVNGVLQELYAALTMLSMVAALRYQHEKTLKHRRVSFKAIVLRLARNFIFFFKEVGPKHLSDLTIGINQFTHRQQSGRNYPRYSRQPALRWVSRRREIRAKKKKAA